MSPHECHVIAGFGAALASDVATARGRNSPTRASTTAAVTRARGNEVTFRVGARGERDEPMCPARTRPLGIHSPSAGQSSGMPSARDTASSSSIRHERTRSDVDRGSCPRTAGPGGAADREATYAHPHQPGDGLRGQATAGHQHPGDPPVAAAAGDQLVGAVRDATGRARRDHGLQPGQRHHVAPGPVGVEGRVEAVEHPGGALELRAQLGTALAVDLQVTVEEPVGQPGGAELEERGRQLDEGRVTLPLVRGVRPAQRDPHRQVGLAHHG